MSASASTWMGDHHERQFAQPIGLRAMMRWSTGMMDDFELDTIDIDELRSLDSPDLLYSPTFDPTMDNIYRRNAAAFSYDLAPHHQDITSTLPLDYENSWVNTEIHRSPPTLTTSHHQFGQPHHSTCRMIPSPLDSVYGSSPSSARRSYPYSLASSPSPCAVRQSQQPSIAAFVPPQRPTPVYQMLDVSPAESSAYLNGSQRQQLLLNDSAECQLLQQSIADSQLLQMSADSTIKLKKGSRRGRRAATNDLEPQTKTAIRQDRRRQSNRRAAEKYRIKQRAQTDSIKTEKERLSMDNDELRAENQKLRDELERYRDYFTKHSIICPLMSRNHQMPC